MRVFMGAQMPPISIKQYTHRRAPTSLLGTDSGPQSLTVCSLLLSDFLLSVAASFLSLVLVYGTTYRQTLPPHRHCSHLSGDLRCTDFVICTRDYTNCFSPTSVVLVPAVCCLCHVKNMIDRFTNNHFTFAPIN